MAEVLQVFVEPIDLALTYPRLFPLTPHVIEDGPRVCFT
jgi:hypothetical protein